MEGVLSELGGGSPVSAAVAVQVRQRKGDCVVVISNDVRSFIPRPDDLLREVHAYCPQAMKG